MQANAPISILCRGCSLQFHGSDIASVLERHQLQSPYCFTSHEENSTRSTTFFAESVLVVLETPIVQTQPTSSASTSAPVQQIQPFYKGMATLTARFKSFKDWPMALLKTLRLSPLNMSLAGFFYTGKGDVVMCFSCGITVKYWDVTTDDPWIRHTSEQSRLHACEFLRVHGKKEKEQRLEPIEMVATNADSKCKICLQQELQIAFLPCKHMSTCESCSLSLSKCIICRSEISSYMRIYLC